MNEMTGGFPAEASLATNFKLLQDVDVRLTVEIGSTQLTLRELLALSETSVIELDRGANELLDVFVNGTLIGRGEVVTVGDRFGVRMTELVSPDKRVSR
ncbi:flagellar motor switch protein FliN [Sphingomonas sp. Leaf24]|uniref:flagellar motor switch protein FliN n=1 Tax=unclassified Sphingomonas TaxID=196159 RepID=UPI0006F74109|nr:MULTISPECIES: flagellar motor switch protein FliN [unclassified Sphingomonas]KQM19956.1 flagellar motor switch protein FliN [Sphingomonas sp. Leaf5]KQM90734.1 flagellar motor switch protein FliN [Sphingomonas sp. Leaf24]KQM93249.1 flagellar motor switch protein FliN [Sphingomonas sp. Leaf22]KQN71415.1 flagellar motor switch protein FliN [Sphingomonas sp. Leaf62]KQN81517.1 flagellar motor switch protein FliN [Sphingomonas sp. Leaf67]